MWILCGYYFPPQHPLGKLDVQTAALIRFFFSELLITHRFIHIKLNNEAKQNSNLVQLSGSPRREHVEENNVSVGIRVLGLITRDDLPNWEHD